MADEGKGSPAAETAERAPAEPGRAGRAEAGRTEAGRAEAGSDARWMRLALALARKAAAAGETPIGAVVVHDGRVIGRGYNRREARADATEHAEMMAIRQASRRLGSWRLSGCDLYVTLEPCLMCAGALINARVRRVVYAAADPKAGACGSVVAAQTFPLFHPLVCEPGPLGAESAELLRAFFRAVRHRDRGRGSKGQRRAEAVAGRKDITAAARLLAAGSSGPGHETPDAPPRSPDKPDSPDSPNRPDTRSEPMPDIRKGQDTAQWS